MSKYIFITGGVCSSLGKGVAASSIGSLLECHGLKIAMMKCDPYINVDAGTISPHQHGEVFVTSDGAETDLDLGNYSRFTHVQLTRANSLTTGMVYQEVIARERQGRYSGRTVQVIPHITDEIRRRVFAVGADPSVDVTIVEIGGTVGDIESIPFIESTRQIIRELGHSNAISIHLGLVPVITGGELKTKPMQHSVKLMQEAGIQPDILLARCAVPLDEGLRKKIALFCNVRPDAVFSSIDVDKTIYELPVSFHEQGIDKEILTKLNLVKGNPDKLDISCWTDFFNKLKKVSKTVKIALVGKYNDFDDCYKSVREAIFHAATQSGVNAELVKIDAFKLETGLSCDDAFKDVSGIIVPASYGSRGVLGMIETARYAREHKIPYLGIDIGMQVMAIETARYILGWSDADSTEFAHDTHYPIVSLPEEQNGDCPSDSFYRVGNGLSEVTAKTLLAKIYKKAENASELNGKLMIEERHRHRYELDAQYIENLKTAGLVVSATSGSNHSLVDAIEWENHPFGIGVQFQPEFISRPMNSHPLFVSFIKSCCGEK